MEIPVGLDGNAFVQVLCCACGISMAPNSANTCANCLASSSDITRGISTEATLHQCKGCQRWHKEAGKWMACELESRELMALCLTNISGLKASKNNKQRIRLIDANWIWTEPHSMRLKVRLTIQKEVQAGTILQQAFTVIFVVRNQQCTECQAEFRQGSWKALVQVRQRVAHKRTFLYLEQLILKHGAHRGCLSIETFGDGMDFYFPDKGKAARFISFLENVVPTKVKTSKKLISTDDKSNISNYKYTNYVEICPLCKDDLLFLPAKIARNLGNIARLVMVKSISNVIHLIDPLTGQTAAMNNDTFWCNPMRPLITAARSRMMRYVVLAKEPVFLRRNVSKRATSRKQRTRLANLSLARESDLGINDNQYDERSHMGYLMKCGDVCVGYDLTETQFVDDAAEEFRSAGKLPNVLIIRKLYGGVATGESDAAKKRIWKIQRLDVKAEESTKSARVQKQEAEQDEMDEEDFMREADADKDMRGQMNLYKSDIAKKEKDDTGDAEMENDDDDSDDDQEVKLEELLENLVVSSGPDPKDNPEEQEEFFGLEEGEKAAKDGIRYVGREESRLMKERESAVPTTEFSDEYDLSDL